MGTRVMGFLLLNFGALALGGLFAGNGAQSNWYQMLAKAPWTPPGWVFGFAWTTIMLCFTQYMAYTFEKIENKKQLMALFFIQWILNVAWNPAFFYFHNAFLGLFIICILTLLVGYFFIHYRNILGLKSLLILPYLIWLCIASSLNAYAFFMN